MAGESALMAMSTRMRIAYLGSCSNVRSDPSRTSRRKPALGNGPRPAVDAHERHAVDDRVTDRPRHRDDRPFPRRESHEALHVDRLDHRGAAAVDEDLADGRQLVVAPGPLGLRAALVAGERGVVALDDGPPLVAGVGEDARDLQHPELLHQHHEEDDAHQQQGDRDPDRQQRHPPGAAAVDPAEGRQRVEEGRGEDAERVAHDPGAGQPCHQARRVRGGAELHHHEGQREDEAGERQHAGGDGREDGDRRGGAEPGREVGKEAGLEARDGHAEDDRGRGVQERRAERAEGPARSRAKRPAHSLILRARW